MYRQMRASLKEQVRRKAQHFLPSNLMTSSPFLSFFRRNPTLTNYEKGNQPIEYCTHSPVATAQ
jgi:hypothetical protein